MGAVGLCAGLLTALLAACGSDDLTSSPDDAGATTDDYPGAARPEGGSDDTTLDADAGASRTGADASADANVDGGEGAVQIAVGAEHTCAILDDASLKCWGWNYHGNLGLGDMQDRGDGPNEMGANLPAVDLGPGRSARAISAGSYHSCAILDDASVKCWGSNSRGNLGLGDMRDRGDGPNEMGANLPAVQLR